MSVNPVLESAKKREAIVRKRRATRRVVNGGGMETVRTHKLIRHERETGEERMDAGNGGVLASFLAAGNCSSENRRIAYP